MWVEDATPGRKDVENDPNLPFFLDFLTLFGLLFVGLLVGVGALLSLLGVGGLLRCE